VVATCSHEREAAQDWLMANEFTGFGKFLPRYARQQREKCQARVEVKESVCRHFFLTASRHFPLGAVHTREVSDSPVNGTLDRRRIT
jgi:hypothetical protein